MGQRVHRIEFQAVATLGTIDPTDEDTALVQ
jgi:hypothetical protein